MSRFVKYFIIVALFVVLLMHPLSYSAAYEVDDYHSLFIEYHNVDGMSASTYKSQINTIFEEDPERFINELSKEEIETIVHHALHLPIEQYYSHNEYTTYESFLQNQLSLSDPNSKKADTVALLLYGSILFQAGDTGNYQKNYQRVQSAFQENQRIFLISLGAYKRSSNLSNIVQCMIYQLDAAGIAALNIDLSNASDASWATEDIRDLIVIIKNLINETPPIDYAALFDKEATVDGYLAEGYYYEVNQIFNKSPEEFITALSKRPFTQINSIAFAIATQENPSLDEHLNEYKNLLISLEALYSEGSPEQETLYIMKLCIPRMDVNSNRLDPLRFEKVRHAEVKSYYNENNRLFLLCVGEMGDTSQSKFADALVYELLDNELKELDDTLAANADADWATEDVKNIIEIFRNRIDEALNPPPSVTEPGATEPLTPDPTSVTEPTEATSPDHTQTQEPADNGWLIPVIAFSTLLTAVIVVIVLRKKKTA